MNFNSLYPKKYIQREIEERVFQFLKDREVIVIRGPRQSGKTTLLIKIGRYLRRKYGKERVVFVNFEDELEKSKFEEDPKDYLSFYLREGKRVFFLLDEVQYLKNGGKILKLLFDSYSQVKFVVSGSSTLDISDLGSFLVGRAVFFELFPFSFSEILEAKNKKLYLEYKAKRFNPKNPKKVDSVHLDKLNQVLKEYLIFGGYPRVVLEKDREKKKILLKNIFNTYVEKDIVKLYGLKYKEKALATLKYLSATVGSLVNFNDLSQTTGLYFREVKEILSIFQETYIIGKVLPYRKNLVTELKKNPKFYFFDSGLRNILADKFNFSSEEQGRLLENYLFLVYKDKKLSFWRTTAKAEVDFVLKDKQIPIEVKVRPKVSRSFLSFFQAYKPQFAVLANWEEADILRRKKTRIFITPLSLI